MYDVLSPVNKPPLRRRYLSYHGMGQVCLLMKKNTMPVMAIILLVKKNINESKFLIDLLFYFYFIYFLFSAILTIVLLIFVFFLKFCLLML